MRVALVLAVLAAAVLCVVAQTNNAPPNYPDGSVTPAMADWNTNPSVPTTIAGNAAVCTSTSTGYLFASVPSDGSAPNTDCARPAFYVGNACNINSAIVPYPASGDFFPGTTVTIPRNQWVCVRPGLQADGSTVAFPTAGGRCISDVRGTCAVFPDGPTTTAARTAVATGWAYPRDLSFTIAQYPRVQVSTGFTNFPLNGADGTYIFPARVETLNVDGTQFFDALCRSTGPVNSRAVICADGSNQNYVSKALSYGFSPASRSAWTFMTYGRGLLRGLTNSFANGGMTVSNPDVYAKYVQTAPEGLTVLPRNPQSVQQKVLPVYSFDPYAYPTPNFVPIGATVDQLITQGIQRLALINSKKVAFRAVNPYANGSGAPTSAETTTDNEMAVKTFRGFYQGTQVGRTSGVYFGGALSPAPRTEANVNQGYTVTRAITGCFGPGPVQTGTTTITAYRINTPTTLSGPTVGNTATLFNDPRFGANEFAPADANNNAAPKSALPSAPGLSAPTQYTCNDWTSRDSAVSFVTGDPGLTPGYTQGNPGTTQPFVNTWLSDNLQPFGCAVSDPFTIYCSWNPTNTDGVRNGDETGIDCGGTTLGADNQGRPTQNCSCTAGQFYDYALALCIPCIQDTYCNLPTGCQNQCLPCFTAPTSGPVTGNLNTLTFSSGGRWSASGVSASQAINPYHYANPQDPTGDDDNLNAVNSVTGTGLVRDQEEAPRSSPYGSQFNTNLNNVILVGTTFNQLTNKYQFQATQCFCNVGFQTSTTSTQGYLRPAGTADPLTGGIGEAGRPGTFGEENVDSDRLFEALPGWTSQANSQLASNMGPFDGSNCVPVVRGDPQITGLQGQDFQVHGIPDEIFNMVSHPDLQVNSRFVFLDEAKCDNYTTCFSHAGTYIDQIGMNIAGQKVKVVAGTLEQGLRVFVEGVEIAVGDKKQLKSARVFFASQRKVHIRTPLFSFAFVGTDKFMNQEVALLDGKLAKLGSKLVTLKAGEERPHQEIPLHGIVGQTWQNLRYPDNMMIEGAVADYRIEESDLFGNTFAFNKFNL